MESHIHVTNDPQPDPEPSGGEHPAAAGSPLADLRRIREEKAATLTKDFKVPRWEEFGANLWARYRPIDAGYADKALRRRQKMNPRPDDWAVLYNADLLIKACVEIFEVEGDLHEGGTIVRRWGGFGPELANDLGVPVGLAETVVRALYWTDGDLLSSAQALGKWSGLATPESEQAFLGE